MIKGQDVILIAESSTTRTEWSLVADGQVLEHAYTSGLNPFFMTRREISHSIRLELPPEFFKRRWKQIYFYGAGCTKEKAPVVATAIRKVFNTNARIITEQSASTSVKPFFSIRSGLYHNPSHARKGVVETPMVGVLATAPLLRPIQPKSCSTTDLAHTEAQRSRVFLSGGLPPDPRTDHCGEAADIKHGNSGCAMTNVKCEA